MFSPATHALLVTVFALHSFAQDLYYTVWSSVVLSRTGERTPLALGELPTVLTSYGALQAHTAGAFMRNRYFGEYTNNGLPGTGAPIQGLSANTFDVDQVYIGTQDYQYTVGSALAWMQGFYPPLNQTSGDTAQQDDTAPITNILADGTVVQAPLGNYQYPLIQTYTQNSFESVYIGAQQDCPAVAIAAATYEMSDKAMSIADASGAFFQKVGEELLGDVLAPEYWLSAYAWYIFDYLNYMNNHDSDAADWLGQEEFVDPANPITNLQQARYYSDQQLWGWYGNPYAINNLTTEPWIAPVGSISTIAGNFIASQLLGQLQQAVKYQAQYYKLNLLWGDFQSLMSWFALSGLPDIDPAFYGMANFASMAAFELHSYTDGSGNAPFPAEEDLKVRFYFQNGTNDDFQSYPLFGRGVDTIDIPWLEFQADMYTLVPGTPGDWCNQCQSPAKFCAYWNASFSSDPTELYHVPKVTPVIAGVIGALVALVVAGIIFAAVMLIGRFRFHRTYSTKNEMGGYKGSQKLASDKDLVLPKGAAVVTTEETLGSPVRGGHERVGSWELKQNEAGLPNIATTTDRRPSYENDDHHDIGEAPWQKPVQPDERV